MCVGGGVLMCTGNGAGHAVGQQQEGSMCVSARLHSQGEAVCRCPVLPGSARFMVKLLSSVLSLHHEFKWPV